MIFLEYNPPVCPIVYFKQVFTPVFTLLRQEKEGV